MKSRGLHAMIALVLAWTPSPPLAGADSAKDGEAGRITLEDAKRYAVAHNFEVEAMRRDLAAAEASTGGKRSLFYPRLGVAAGMEHQITDLESESVTVGYAYLSYRLFNGFADVYGVRIADQEAAAKRIELESARFEIGLDVELAFHEILLQQELIKAKEKAIARNDENLETVARTRRAGLAAATDVMEFEIKGALLRSELLEHQQDLAESRITLKKLLGDEVGRGLSPVGSLQHRHVESDLPAYLEKISDHSVPIRMAANLRERRETESRLWRSRWLPTIDLEARTGFLPLDERGEDPEETATRVGLVATWEIFSGLGTAFERRQRLEALHASEARLKERILQAVTTVESLFLRLKTIEKRVDLEEGNERLAERYYETVRKDYLRGYKNSADLAAAAEGVLEARERRIRFMFDFLRQKIELERITGVPVATRIAADGVPRNNTKKGKKG